MQYVDHTEQTLTVATDGKQIQLLIHGFDQKQYKAIDSICLEERMKTLIFDVSSLYNTNTIIIKATDDPLLHGSFDPKSKNPAVWLSPATGIKSSTLAHELIHAIQNAQGFPTMIIPTIYTDNRKTVLVDLCSDILHINLTKIMTMRGFENKSSLQPTLDNIQKSLNDRSSSIERTLTFLRAHYEAVAYLRIHFEANYLSATEKHRYTTLYKKKVPIALRLARQLIAIISKYDVDTPNGCIKAMYASVLFLNDCDISKSYLDYYPNPYAQILEYWRNKYFSILDIH